MTDDASPPQGPSADEEMRRILRQIVAQVLPAPAGTLLVLKLPVVDWQDQVHLAGLDAVIKQIKREHGFAGVIAVPLGTDLQSMDADGLRAIGLQPIPEDVP